MIVIAILASVLVVRSEDIILFIIVIFQLCDAVEVPFFTIIHGLFLAVG